jgi:hypothetical protein
VEVTEPSNHQIGLKIWRMLCFDTRLVIPATKINPAGNDDEMSLTEESPPIQEKFSSSLTRISY